MMIAELPYKVTSTQLDFMTRMMSGGYRIAIIPRNPHDLVNDGPCPTIELYRYLGNIRLRYHACPDGTIRDPSGAILRGHIAFYQVENCDEAK